MSEKTEKRTNTVERILIQDYLDQGYEVMGVIDKDSTDEDIHEMCKSMVEKTAIPDDHPVWNMLTEAIVDDCSPRTYVYVHTDDDVFDELEKELPIFIASGGTEDEYWLRLRRELEAGR